MKAKKSMALALAALMLAGGVLSAGFGKKKETVVIYSSDAMTNIEKIQNELTEQFPDYEIVMEYIPTGQQAARLLAEGTDTECDISMELTYNYLYQLDEAGLLADVSDIVDFSRFVDDVNQSDDYVIENRLLGVIAVNTEMMERLGLPEPTCYEDLLDPQYEGLIAMSDPRTSGTGYMYLKGLVNAWGEEKAFDYFEKLSKNIVQFTAGGSGVTNCVVQQEAAIGLGIAEMTYQSIQEGEPVKMIYLDEGTPFILYGQAVVEGKQERECVREVFQYLTGPVMEPSEGEGPCPYSLYSFVNVFHQLPDALEEALPEIAVADMSGDTIEEQERLLDMWTITDAAA